MRSTVYTITLLLIMAGCKSERPQPGSSGPQPTAESKEEHRGEANDTLRIEPEMLRDLKITTAEVEARPGAEGSMLLGELRVNENSYAELGVPVPSRVMELHVSPGQSVKTGTPLATLQSIELGKARADLITARARLDLAHQVLARKERLGEEKIVPQREIQEAEANAATADAEVRAARASLRALGASGDEASDSSTYQLRSPIPGIVIERKAIRGQMASPEEKLFTVGDLSSLWLTVQAFERDAVRISPGSQVRMSFPAIPGSSFTGKVDLIGREVNRESRTVPVRVVIPNKDGRLRPGMSATAWIAPSNESAAGLITVPVTSLQRVADDWVVFLPGDHQGEFEVRKVGRGRDLGGEIEIVSGLKRGEKIVIDGAFLLKAEAEKAHGGGEEHEH